MKRNAFFTSAALFCGVCLFSSTPFVEAAQPNILIIIADDLGYGDLGCQGVTDFETPNIDALAAAGVRFTDGYVTAPQCGPSRAGLITGVNQARFNYMDIASHSGLPPKEVVQTLPEQLKDRGYATGIIGKWHVGYDHHRLFMLPGNHPWERGFDYTLTHDHGLTHYYPYRADGQAWMADRKLEYRLEQKMENKVAPVLLEGLPEDTYLTDYFSDQACRFIERHQDQPWFLYLSYNAPHTPMIAKPDMLRKYQSIKDPTRRALAAIVDSLDQGVGTVLAALEAAGQKQNTIVWFVSDNGGETPLNGSKNGPLAGRKGDVHEGGIRVPFLVVWPGTIPAGKVEHEPVSTLDILPTCLLAAGADQIPSIHDGHNILPWLKGEAPCPNKELFWWWRGKSAIRLGDLKEARNGNDVTAADGSTVPGHMFSNIRKNPEEHADQALQSPEQRQLLSTALDAWLRKISADQKVLTPVLNSKSAQYAVVAPSLIADLRSIVMDDFSNDSGRWATRGVSKDISFNAGQLSLTVSPNGQPVAAYLAMDPIALKDGQTIRISADVSTTRTMPRPVDIRMAIGFADPVICNNEPGVGVPLAGYYFSAPSGGISAGVRATSVRGTGKNENFFNSPKASRSAGMLATSGSVSSTPATWIVDIKREGTSLIFSGSLGGVSYSNALELSQAECVISNFEFNTIGFAYAFSPGETASIDNVKVSVSP